MEFNHGDHVRIDEYGGDHASRNDKLYNGRTGTVDLESNPGQHYIRVVLDDTVETWDGYHREDVLCDPVELTVIE